jgi:O-antigen/teichoic acid export membrane protein
MSRSMVGLLAAVTVAMSALVGLIHGDFMWVILASAVVSGGLASYFALPSSKNFSFRPPPRSGVSLLRSPLSVNGIYKTETP